MFQLSEPSIWIDEAYTAEATGWDYDRVRGELWWVYYTFVKTWTMIAGTSEFALRFPSVIGAVVAVALMYGFVVKLMGPRIAVIASLLLALNPFVVKWSQQARGYSILLALVIASTWLLLYALEKNVSLAWVGYGLVLVLMIHWHSFSALIFLPVHVLIAWRNPRALVTWSFTLTFSLPWLVFFVTRPAGDRPTSWISSPDLTDVAAASLQVPGALGVGLALALVGAVLVDHHRRLLLAWAVVPASISLVASLFNPVFLDRYLIVSCPAFAVLGAIAVRELAGRMRVAAIGSFALATLIALSLWYAPSEGNNWAGENWRAATMLVMRDGGARVTPSWAEAAFRYYGGRSANNGWVLQRREPNEDFKRTPYVRRAFGDTLRVLHRPSVLRRGIPTTAITAHRVSRPGRVDLIAVR